MGKVVVGLSMSLDGFIAGPMGYRGGLPGDSWAALAVDAACSGDARKEHG